VAGTGEVQGRLLGRDGKPVPGAEVRVFPGTARIVTDTSGRFRAAEAAPGMRDFFVKRFGYVPVMVSVEVAAGDTASVTIQLEAAAQMLAPVTIEARVTSMNLAGFDLRRQAGVGGGTFIGPEELRKRENGTLQTVLRSLSRISIEESAATGDARIYGRAGAMMADTMVKDRCTMRVLVDGALLPDGTPMSGLPPVREIGAIEIYQAIGAVPPMYSFSMPECGLMVIWTRDWASPDRDAARGPRPAPFALPRHPVDEVVRRELVGVVGEVDGVPAGPRPLHVVADVVVVIDHDEEPLARVVVLVDPEELGARGIALRVVHPLE
jgi:hypothetical protein